MPESPDPRHERDDRDQTADELAWQSIVANYGERAELEEPSAETPPEAPAPDSPFGGRFADASGFATWSAPDELAGRAPAEPDADPTDDEHDGYVPPPPPPLPRLAPDRALAWGGVFGSPLLLLLALLLSISIPSWLGYLMIAGFVGGFGYLVAKMPREPRDPWDDGAQV